MSVPVTRDAEKRPQGGLLEDNRTVHIDAKDEYPSSNDRRQRCHLPLLASKKEDIEGMEGDDLNRTIRLWRYGHHRRAYQRPFRPLGKTRE